MKSGGKRASPSAGKPSRSSGGRSFTLAEVARSVGGRVAGEPKTRLTGVAPLGSAGPGDLSWVADARHAALASQSGAGALLVVAEADAAGKPAVVVENPTAALAGWLARHFPAERPRAGISKRAHVHSTARLARGVSIAAGAVVEAGASIGARTALLPGAFVGRGARVGEDCLLHPHAAVLERCRVGSRCELHAGAVVGSDGFGYSWDGDRHVKIPQRGIVRVEDDVEIGANSAIDRATFGETVIGRGTKIDNLVQVGHNVVIGEHSIVCGQAGIAGSASLGRRVTLAGQVGVNHHISIGDGTIATGQAGVTGNLPAGGVFSGMPAAPHREFLKRSAWVARLPELARRVEDLERRAAVAPKADAPKGDKPWKSGSPKS